MMAMDVNTELSLLIDNGSSFLEATGYSLDVVVDHDLDESTDLVVDWLLTLTLIVKTCLMGLIIAASIFGNLLVIISVARFRKLRIITNYFVVSLAMADILVALVAMGFNASVIIFGKWMFGYAMCDIWNSFDVYFCTVSILHLCCISVDRYYAISQPLMYPMKITRKKVAVMLANIWTWPALISYLPIILGWYTTDEHLVFRTENPDSCRFVVNQVYAVISSSISFWIPCAIMLFTYYRIYQMASRQEKMLLKNADAALLFRQQNQRRSAEMEQHQIHHINNSQHHHQQQQATGKVVSPSAQHPTAVTSATGNTTISTTNETTVSGNVTGSVAIACLPNGAGGHVGHVGGTIVPAIQVTLAGCIQPDVLLEANGRAYPSGRNYNPTESNQQHQGESGVPTLGRGEGVVSSSSSPPPEKRSSAGDRSALLDGVTDGRCHTETSTPTMNKDKHLQKIRREHKAARTLGIIMGAFVLCWLPFFIWYLSISLCGDHCYCPDIVVEVLFWIGYFNSTLNPLIYAYFNKDFREAFRNTLVCVFCTRCQDPREQQRDQMAANFQGNYGNLSRLGLAVTEQRIRHSSGDTIAGIERIDHKRLSGVAVQNL